MELKLQWLQTRKQQLLKQVSECDQKVSEVCSQSLSDVKDKQQELEQFKKTSQRQISQLKEQFAKASAQIKTLEAVILAKEEQLDRLKSQYGSVSKSNEQRGDTIQTLTGRLLQLEHGLKVNGEESERRVVQLERKLTEIQIHYTEELKKQGNALEQSWFQKQIELNKSHADKLSQMKKANLKLLEKIEAEHQATLGKTTTLSKQNQTDYTRITQESTKLISANNQLKFKLLNIQNTLSTTQQQQKIALKEMQITKDNYRRELQMLKEERTDLKNKNRKLNEKVDQLSWEVKQVNLKREEDVKKIRMEVDHSFKDVLLKAEEEKGSLRSQNEVLKTNLGQKTQEAQGLQDIGMKLKGLVQDQETELKDLRQKAHLALKQNQLKQGDTMKTELIRKNCQIQVLKQQIKRLKSKVNKLATAYQQHLKQQQQMHKQNKMLMSEIVFLRQKQKKQKNLQVIVIFQVILILNNLRYVKIQRIIRIQLKKCLRK